LDADSLVFDPIDLALYVCNRLQLDNEWMVEKVRKLEGKQCGACPGLLQQIDELRRAIANDG
jgi:hypothetical protein